MEHVSEKTCSMAAFLVISDKKSQTGLTLGHLKNLWVEFWEGCLHRVHLGESFIPHLKSLLFFIQVFLRILYCRSFASGIFNVLASFEICFPIKSDEMLYSSLNFLNVPQCFGLKDFGNRVFASSLQPFLLGLEASSMGSAAGK